MRLEGKRPFTFENGVISDGNQAESVTLPPTILFENGVISDGNQAVIAHSIITITFENGVISDGNQANGWM